MEVQEISTDLHGSSDKPNRLINEKSPYLLQHAHNPVDWFPWSDEAFNKAKEENKPIFLSIGYSTCHWCHVMERESFEDSEVARLMNDTFVSIKVDREERPDIDNVYMSVCQAMTGGGGWPLTIILTPDKDPFFATTYVPREARFDRGGMLDLVPSIKEAWEKKNDEIHGQAQRFTTLLKKQTDDASVEVLDENVLSDTFLLFWKRFDTRYGGFGGAPKFPSPHNLLFLLRYWRRSGDPKALEMVSKTLTSMRAGGIYDHLGFGFHRYSTDQMWLIPHFEKMLYDQALLAMVYTEAYQVTKKEDLRQTAKEIFTYVLRDMTSPKGGFFSAEDADSEGVEGKFYLWTTKELKKALSKEQADIFIRVFNLKEGGNFTDPITQINDGANILHQPYILGDIAKDMNLSEPELASKMDDLRESLFQIRDKRVHPHKDDKVLTDWNGLMIAALAKGAQVFGDKVIEDAAIGAADFIINELREKDGRLLHRYRDGQAAISGNLDDYAFFIWGLLELYETTFERRYLENAMELDSILSEDFWDDERGGFYFTPKDVKDLIVRQKEIYDGAMPSGNSVHFMNLLKIHKYTGDPRFLKRASKLKDAFSKKVEMFSTGHTFFLCGLDFSLGPSYEVVIKGEPDVQGTIEMIAALQKNFIPNKVILLNPTNEGASAAFRFPDYFEDYSMKGDDSTAYVCSDNACQTPTTSTMKMLELLDYEK